MDHAALVKQNAQHKPNKKEGRRYYPKLHVFHLLYSGEMFHPAKYLQSKQQTKETALPARVSPSRRFVELVSNAANRQHVLGFLGIGLELLSQSIDMGIDVALVAFVVGTPNLI